MGLAAKSLQSCPTLCDPIDGSPPGSPIPGILQARTLEWVAISFSRGSFQPRNRTQVSCIAGRHFYRLSHQEAQGCVLQFSSILENFMSFSLFYCSPFFSSLGTSTTHILHCLKLSHSSLMLFSLLKKLFFHSMFYLDSFLLLCFQVH